MLYVDADQIVAVVPSDAAVNTQPQLVVQRGKVVGLPSSIIIFVDAYGLELALSHRIRQIER